jgi:aspartyl aminopeptidase
MEKKLHDKLFKKNESAWLSYKEPERKKIYAFAEKYKDFLNTSKTERVATKTIVTNLVKAGFRDIEKIAKLKIGDKVFFNYKGKSVIAAVIGKTKDSIRLVGSHIDSPRLDLKPNPIAEDKSLVLLKTHYYGGVKKYQWTNTELALYGVIHTKAGKRLEFSIGEKDDEPRFIFSDLLPHLAKKQMEKTGNDLVEGEQLNIFVGNIPLKEKDVTEGVKLNTLKILNDKYGLTEEDFSFAELTFVPAGQAHDIGFDKSMVAGYGQDDKACSFANMMAILDVKNPKVTAISYFSDKEEIGSVGDTGAYSFILINFAELLAEKLGTEKSATELLFGGRAISADVGAAVNPSFADVHDDKNSCITGFGVIVEKYSGAGGKYNANDANAEYMSYIREVLDKNKIIWQTGEIGKIDAGGGNTIALFMSRYGIDTVDAGPGVLGMHSPREVTSKVDLYEAYRLYKAFLED